MALVTDYTQCLKQIVYIVRIFQTHFCNTHVSVESNYVSANHTFINRLSFVALAVEHEHE